MITKAKNMLNGLKTKIATNKKALATVGLAGIASQALATSGFCAETVAEFTITAETVAPVTNAINSGLTTLIPIGIGIMATFIGISLIKRVIYTFL